MEYQGKYQKTEAIVFTKNPRTLEAPIKIRNRTLPYNSTVKYLGLTLDSKLTFKSHITKTVNKPMVRLVYYIHYSNLTHYQSGLKSYYIWL